MYCQAGKFFVENKCKSSSRSFILLIVVEIEYLEGGREECVWGGGEALECMYAQLFQAKQIFSNVTNLEKYDACNFKHVSKTRCHMTF
jgi:hypothetical protein